MITKLIAVGIGGAAGSMLRFALQYWLNTTFPYGTLLVNILGCLIAGMLWGLVSKEMLDETMRVLMIAGFCGGFTTLSAFSLEGNELFLAHRYFAFIGYLFLTIAGGLLATFAGFKIVS